MAARAHGSSRAEYLCEIPGVTERKNCFFRVILKKNWPFWLFFAHFSVFFDIFYLIEPDKDSSANGASKAKYLGETPEVLNGKNCFFKVIFSKKQAFLGIFCPFLVFFVIYLLDGVRIRS